jgi:hypothetical protein
MRVQKRLLLLVTTFCVVGSPTTVLAQRQNFEFHSYGQSENYGVKYSDFMNAANQSFTPTEHHRFGQRTGIGSSTAQTESSTVESMPRVRYTPTEATVYSPPPSPAMGAPNRFSNRMFATPALTPVFTSESGISGMPKQHILPSLDELRLYRVHEGGSLDIGGEGRKHSRGGMLDLQLLNPFQELNH